MRDLPRRSWHHARVATSSPPQRRDLVLAFAYGAVGALTFLVVDMRSPLTGDDVPAWAWVPCVALGVVLVARRRQAGWATVALGALIVLLLGLNGGAYAGLLIFELVFSATVHGSRRARHLSWAYGIALVVLVAAVMAAGRAPLTEVASTVVVFLALVGMAAWWGANVYSLSEQVSEQRLRARAQELAARAELEAAGARQALAIAEERARFGRDVHDIIAGRLAAIAMQSAMVLPRTADDPRTHELIQDIHDCSTTTLAQVRDLIEVLAGREDWRAVAVDDPRSSLALLVLTAATIGAEITVEDELADPHSLEARTLYVLAQEVVVNMFRHSSPCRGRVELRREGAHLVLRGHNELGTGARRPADDPVLPEVVTASGGHGLGNLRGRVAPLGGLVTSGPSPDGRYWQVCVRIPIGTEDDGTTGQPAIGTLSSSSHGTTTTRIP